MFFLGVFQETMFSSSDLHMKTFTAHAVLSPVQNSDNSVRQGNDVPNNFQVIVDPVNYSNVLRKTFKSKCNEFISSTKKSAKDYYINMLGYSTIFLKKTRKVNDVLEGARLSKMKEPYENLNGQCPAGVRDNRGEC